MEPTAAARFRRHWPGCTDPGCCLCFRPGPPPETPVHRLRNCLDAGRLLPTERRSFVRRYRSGELRLLASVSAPPASDSDGDDTSAEGPPTAVSGPLSSYLDTILTVSPSGRLRPLPTAPVGSADTFLSGFIPAPLACSLRQCDLPVRTVTSLLRHHAAMLRSFWARLRRAAVLAQSPTPAPTPDLRSDHAFSLTRDGAEFDSDSGDDSGGGAIDDVDFASDSSISDTDDDLEHITHIPSSTSDPQQQPTSPPRDHANSTATPPHSPISDFEPSPPRRRNPPRRVRPPRPRFPPSSPPPSPSISSSTQRRARRPSDDSSSDDEVRRISLLDTPVHPGRPSPTTVTPDHYASEFRPD